MWDWNPSSLGAQESPAHPRQHPHLQPPSSILLLSLPPKAVPPQLSDTKPSFSVDKDCSKISVDGGEEGERCQQHIPLPQEQELPPEVCWISPLPATHWIFSRHHGPFNAFPRGETLQKFTLTQGIISPQINAQSSKAFHQSLYLPGDRGIWVLLGAASSPSRLLPPAWGSGHVLGELELAFVWGWCCRECSLLPWLLQWVVL